MAAAKQVEQDTPDEETPLVQQDPRYIPKDKIEYEFGGPVGALGMMVGFPLLMWYMWICARFNNGKFAYPTDGQSWKDFIIDDLYSNWYEYGIPTFGNWAYFTGFMIIQALFTSPYLVCGLKVNH